MTRTSWTIAPASHPNRCEHFQSEDAAYDAAYDASHDEGATYLILCNGQVWDRVDA